MLAWRRLKHHLIVAVFFENYTVPYVCVCGKISILNLKLYCVNDKLALYLILKVTQLYLYLFHFTMSITARLGEL